MSNFYNDLRKAKAEELRYKRYLESRGWDCYVSNKRQDQSGTDLFAISSDRKVYEVDVKSDGRISSTGNIGLELYTEYESGKANRPGWATEAKADVWVILFRGENRAISLDPTQLVMRLPELSKKYPVKPTRRDQGKATFNLLIPVNALEEEGITFNDVSWN